MSDERAPNMVAFEKIDEIYAAMFQGPAVPPLAVRTDEVVYPLLDGPSWDGVRVRVVAGEFGLLIVVSDDMTGATYRRIVVAAASPGG